MYINRKINEESAKASFETQVDWKTTLTTQ